MYADGQDMVPGLLPKCFDVGQLVACVVLQCEDDRREERERKRILLSLRLSVLYKGLSLEAVQDGMVLTAQVKSVEDHGYILHFGVPSFRGFLPRVNNGGGVQICRGQLLQCVVKSIDTVRAVVYTDFCPDLMSSYVCKDRKGISIDLLVPGMMVDAQVHSQLDNGIMLSFLTYFTGTVDVFHLQNPFPTENWKNDYTLQKKVNARILFVDPSTRAVGLTMNPYLVQYKTPPMNVETGEIYDNSHVLRIDGKYGLLLNIPSSPEHTPAYVHQSDVADEEVNLLKKFKVGDLARLRVLGIRNLEGLAIGTLKTSAFGGDIFTHSDIKPGMLVKAKVIAVEPFGALVQLASSIKALCPLRHMSEFARVKPSKKFQIGAELLFRVLGCKSKRITVTHKRNLVKSKLEVLASYADAVEGLVTHGWITKVEKHGCYVKFYNGVTGFAPRSELGLEPGIETNTVYHVEQVVRCRVTSSVPGSRKISVSFLLSPKRVNGADMVKLGSIVGAVVDYLAPTAVIVVLKKFPNLRGSLSYEHLADHIGQIARLKPLLRPGYEFDQLVVLDIEGSNLILSAKYSLVCYAEDIPLDLTDMHPMSIARGYICNIIEGGCFVRFLGRLTGFSPKNRATDCSIGNLSDAFYVGQSVRSYIDNVDHQAAKIKLTLKQSLCFSTEASYIQGYFLVEDKISALQAVDGKRCDVNWVKGFSIGSVVTGEIQEIKEFGVVISFENYVDVVGFVSQHQMGGIHVEKGSLVRAFILDISKTENLVDLSLNPELVSSKHVEMPDNLSNSKKKRQRASPCDFELHQTVNATVEIVKENYLVLSLPEHNYAVGYAPIKDYNTEMLPPKHFSNGQRLLASVGALPNVDSNGRLLLSIKSLHEVLDLSTSKRARKLSNYTIGSLVKAEILDINSSDLLVKFAGRFHGKVNINEVDSDDNSPESPFSRFRVGQLVDARIIAKIPKSRNNEKTFKWLLSMRHSVLSGQMETLEGPIATDNFSVGTVVSGYVVKVESEWVRLTIARRFRGDLYILDSSSEPEELQKFQKRYIVGQTVTGRIINVNKKKKVLRLKSCLASFTDKAGFVNEIVENDNDESFASNDNGISHVSSGDIIGGRIKKILPNVGGIFVQIGPHLFGRVHYCEVADSWLNDPLSRYQEGQFVKCKVLEVCRSSSGFVHVDLSLRPSLTDSAEHASTEVPSFKRVEMIDELHPNMEVHVSFHFIAFFISRY
ncbi:hypothetical protein HPP92_027317 [Vanilla planifolia]|uniref:S1 motif domain-containing protein n=1 Tax=Vanilla planifolia TaxID=51239 RepID=A0A835PBN2_VANPL|nr:hypothetical protein HPP92_027317 [Vanilla planifolia]